MTAATVTATVQYFPLRQGNVTDPTGKTMFPETHKNSTSLEEWMTVATSLKNEGKIKGKESETNHEHYRLVDGAYDNRHLEQICCIDDHHSGTQAAVWCDSTHKQVIVRKIVA